MVCIEFCDIGMKVFVDCITIENGVNKIEFDTFIEHMENCDVCKKNFLKAVGSLDLPSPIKLMLKTFTQKK